MGRKLYFTNCDTLNKYSQIPREGFEGKKMGRGPGFLL